MRTLIRTLQDQDLGFLRAVHELWGLELPSGSSRIIAETLAESMLQPPNLEELVESLPEQAQALVQFLVSERGRAPFAQIDRTYGPLREMGPGRRDREQPWREPASPLEVVWYRGLLGRAFADSPVGPQEFIFIPSDILPLLTTIDSRPETLMGCARDAPAVVNHGDSSAVDDATTLLAAFRKHPPARVPLSAGRNSQLTQFIHQPHSLDMLVWLLIDLGYMHADTYQLSPEHVRSFLEASRSNALQILINAWHNSLRWNDLAALPHLQFTSSEWPNDARLSRSAALEILRFLPEGEWWDLSAFITDVKHHHPAFQRPGGDFKAWYLQDGSGAFLNGFEHWDSVDGAYLRYLIQGPIHWLGMNDLGRTSTDGPAVSFRLTPAWNAIHQGHGSINVEQPDSKIIVQPNGEVIVPRGADRVTRYQIARISSWEPPSRLGHRFRLTPGTLQAASEQGLNTNHILQLLEQATDDELPPSVVRAVERWSQEGMEAQLSNVLLLRVDRSEILEKLADHQKTGRYIAEILSPTTAVIRSADWPALRDAAARLGLLLEPPDRNSSA